MAQKYQKFTHLEHILARPDTYVGSLKEDISQQWIFQGDKLIQKYISWIPGLYKIFDEILVNAIDQCQVYSQIPVDTIKITISPTCISVYNNGVGIPVEIQNDVYIPEMIFGQLLTSSNYDDTEARTTGGRNGYGAKLANVFSTRFEIDIGSTTSKKRYQQSWTNNMTEKSKASITKYTKAKGYVQITFYPDFKRFGIEKLSDDMISLFTKRVYDTCACTKESIKVFLNDSRLNIKSFEKYTELYTDKKKVVDTEHPRWSIVVATSDSYKQVSFVNGIATNLGGSHVEAIVSQIVKKITENLTNKHKDLKIKPGYIKDHLFVFVKSTLVNPSFSSQTKEECTSRFKDFGSRIEITDDFVKKIMKLGIVDDIVALAKHKENRELNKTDGKKKSTIKGIPKLEDANKAGTSQSKHCTLILTEGDSAKTFAISGLSVVGRDYYGVFPLKGKLLNVRDASIKQLLSNEEINNIKQIVGLQQDKDYSKSIDDLRYGKVMILTDADVDGSHIKGLFINFIHTFWGSLIHDNNFLTAMRTPIIKARKGSQVVPFYTMQEYNEWFQRNTSSQWKIKYYKGLGTSTAQEAREYFQELQKNKIDYQSDTNTDKNIQLAFKKTLSNSRKEWIQDGSEKKETLDNRNKVSYSDFINKDLIWFSIADNVRSIPNVIDGLKPSQRKVLYGFKKRTNTEVKVSQVSGYISTETSYHHGEQSLMGTIINMAQDYVGSNNINLLEPIGQFGTRLLGGKDAASPRYIFTKMTTMTDIVFDSRDNALLKYLEDDGSVIEPEYYVPILPMVLVNGAEGIGTGYSTSIPCYNPEDIIDNLNRYMNNEPLKKMIPWYKGFRGLISQNGQKEHQYLTQGVYRMKSDTEIEITELPIGKWTSDYKEFLDDLAVKNKIKSYENHSGDTNINFKVVLNEPVEDICQFLHLTTTLSTNNMHCFDDNGKIEKYDSAEDIIKSFAKVRIEFYKKRRDHLLKKMTTEMNEMSEDMRFIKLVIDETIKVFRIPNATIKNSMNDHKFKEEIHNRLLSIKLSQFTLENVQDLQKRIRKIKEEIKTLESKSKKDLWIDDLSKIK